ncbi:McrB family protein [Niveibacterium sp. 24ML]|uniref:McrB family protein n=1 Tax=Niveibacterium sp. 24ML TaxID=2985512 RepID=UPI002B4BF553|nr:AAA family ATPase [Niveibacterium sp. 24ML]
MVDENQTLTWDAAVQLLDANFHFRAPAGTTGRTYRASPNGPALTISQAGQALEVQLPKKVDSLAGEPLSLPGQSIRYSVSTVGELLHCIGVLTDNVKKDVAYKTAHEFETGNSGMAVKQPLNTILYGPPGTGKTYSVVLKALSIVDAKDYGLEVSADVYQELKKRYDALVRDGQIAFVTFHQSYGYEDFIEGIRPQTEGGQISYAVRDGVLKAIALAARENWRKSIASDKETLDDDALFERVWQELADTLEEQADGKVKVTLYKGGEAELELGQTGKNVVVSLPGYKTTYPISKKQLKSLWGRRLEVARPSDTKLYNRSFFWAVLEHLKEIAANAQPVAVQPEALKPYILIIDEINRGNISKIFGELITLVEEDKRLGEPFEMTVTLPYSQGDEEPFGLPPNLYLVGTMNTSDRSIALLDTALRRRFEFEELQPNPSVLKRIELDADVDLPALLDAINERVEYLYDRDHTIGHAYFVGVKTLSDLERVFRRKVIPLLQEYFYEDWSKVALVLNDSTGRFIEQDVRVPKGLQGSDIDSEPKPRFRVKDSPFLLDAFQNIYSGQ